MPKPKGSLCSTSYQVLVNFGKEHDIRDMQAILEDPLGRIGACGLRMLRAGMQHYN